MSGAGFMGVETWRDRRGSQVVRKANGSSFAVPCGCVDVTDG